MAALFMIARADTGPGEELHPKETDFLKRLHRAFDLPPGAWDRAATGRARPETSENDAYIILGISQSATDQEVRTRWRALIREHHPDVLSQKKLNAAEQAKAADRVARINAAWDRIKRDRRL